MNVDENVFFREALRESQERQRVTLQTAMDGFFRTDMQGRILEVNETYCRMSGYSEQELLTMQIADIEAVHTARMIAANIRSFAELSPKRFESVHRRKDGHLFDVEISGQYQPIAGGQIVVFVRDITERKRAAEALQRSEAYLAEAQRLSHTGSWAFDVASDKYVYVSEECLRIFELHAEQDWPSREAVSKLIHPEDWDRTNKDYEKALREKVDTLSEFRIVLPTGVIKHVRAIRHPVLNDAGEVVKLVGTVIDITERVRAEEEVRQTAAQWQATFDAVQDLVLLLDKDFRILRANRAAAEFLGQRPDTLVGGHCYDLMHGTSTPPAECPLAKMRQSRRHEEVEILAREGGPWLSVSVDPVFDPSGQLTQVVHIARDITDRKRAEEDLRRSEVYLAEGQRLSRMGSWAWSAGKAGRHYWSEEMFRIFGFETKEGPPPLELFLQRIHPEDYDQIAKDWEKTV